MMYDTWYLMHDTLCMTRDTCCFVRDMWRMIRDTWYVIYDTWYVTHDIWYMTRKRYVMYDTWYVTRGPWYVIRIPVVTQPCLHLQVVTAGVRADRRSRHLCCLLPAACRCPVVVGLTQLPFYLHDTTLMPEVTATAWIRVAKNTCI